MSGSAARRRCAAALAVFAMLLTSLVASPSTPAAAAESTGQVDAQGQAWRTHDITPTTAGTVTASLAWPAAGADLNLFVRRVDDPDAATVGPMLSHSSTASRPEQLSWEAVAGQTYRLYVQAAAGVSDYTLSTDQTADPERRYLGTAASAGQTYRAHPFSVTAPTVVAGSLGWTGGADLGLYLRTESGAVVDVIRSDANPERLTAEVPAGDYEWLVRAESGTAAYEVTSSLRQAGALTAGQERHFTAQAGFVSTGGGRQVYESHDVTVGADGELGVQLDAVGNANLDLYLSPLSTGGQVGAILLSSATTADIEQLSLPVSAGERYRLTVKATSGASGYDLRATLRPGPGRSIVGTTDPASQNWRTYTLAVDEPGLLTAELGWSGPGDLALYLRDPEGDLVAISKTTANPERIAFEVDEPGDHQLVVSSTGSAAAFTLDAALQTGAGRSFPGHLGFTATGGGRQGYDSFDFTATEDGTATASLGWQGGANLDLYVREVTDPQTPDAGPLLASSQTPATPEQLSFSAEAGSTYRLYVSAPSGSAHFDLDVAVQATADERTFLGTSHTTGQRYRTYPFEVSGPGTLSGSLSWQGPADLSLFVRDPDGALVGQSVTAGNPEQVSVGAERAGAYQLVVAANSGFAAFSLDAAFVADEPAAACTPLSTLGCDALVPEPPVALTFDGAGGGLVDGDGEGTGFTLVDPPSARLAADGAPSNPEVPGFEPSLLDVADGTLTVEATRGIQYADNVQTTGTNSLLNALGVGVEAADAVTTVRTTVVAPDFDATANAEKGGLWFGLDEDNLVNLSVQNQSGTNVRVQFQREVGGKVVGATDEKNSAVFPEGTDVALTMVLDAEAGTAVGSYQVGGAAPVSLGSFPVPASFFEGAALGEGGTPASLAGVFATERNEATTPVTVTFDDFGVQVERETAPGNTAPEVLLTGDRTLVEGQQTRIPVGTFDEDDDEVAVTVAGLPEGLAYTDGVISGTLAQDTVAEQPYTVEVTGDDGTATSTASFTITVLDDLALDINFQPATAPVPAGYRADTGAAFGDRGDGLSYGWVAQGGDTPLDMSKNARLRDRTGIDPRLNTLMHLQYRDIQTVFGGSISCTTNQCEPGAWELAVPEGLYEVTVSVGDQPGAGTVYDSRHAINVENGVAIAQFQATSAEEFREVTVQTGVEDGRLTVSAIGGQNTKINYVRVRSLGAQPFVTATVPALRATDVALDTSVSASVSVPGTGLGVDPDRDTSLTDAAVKLFEQTPTGEVEVTGNRGSTGGNDTISFSPGAALKPDTTYRYVIDGVLDEAGNTFGAFQTYFTTGDDGGGQNEEEFTPVEGVSFEKVLLPTASGSANGKYFASLVVHDGHLWATTIGQGMFRYEILPDGTLGPAQDLGLFAGRAAVGLVFDTSDPDLAWVTHATANLGNESARIGSTLSVVDFSDVDAPVVTDVFTNLPRSQKDHLSNSLSYGPSGDGGEPWLYFLQGSNQAAGDVDGAWGTRGETQLTAALLRFDPQQALQTARTDGPIDVATEEVGGDYDPYADGAPLEIYATGIRNAYDLLWHSNGHLYVPTNGTAGGGNSPGVTVAGGTMTMSTTQQAGQNGYGNGTDVTEVCSTRRIDGQPYTGGSVPAVTNHPTQRDFLFDVEQGGYYGHPNPTRCEWALNNAGLPAGAGSGGSKYPASTQPDPNYRGWAYDFDFNKSPNGVIEYTSDTFGGALKDRMMVVRFSGNDDILTMQVADDGEVLGAQNGTDVPGFTGYADPLDLIEDTSVNPGNLYINQYNRGGEPQELYLLRVPEGETAGGIDVSTDSVTMSATLNTEQPTDSTQITLHNTGDEPVAVTAALRGAHAGQFSVGTPGTVAAGGEKALTIGFDPSGSVGVRTAELVLSTPDGVTRTVALRALAFQGQEGGEEPPLQLVLDALELEVTAGWSGLAGGTDPAPKGDEVLAPLFERAGDGPVTMRPVAAFAPQEDLPFGWYTAEGSQVTTHQVGSIANGQLQTLHPGTAAGSQTEFDPGEEEFGLYYFSNTFDRTGYTEDARNDSGGLHRARTYPLGGDRFLVAFEDAANGDYQDYVFVVENVRVAGQEPPPVAETVKVNFQSADAPVPAGYLRDSGEAFGTRSGADQGSGLSYGWVGATSGQPLGLVGNGRDRNLAADQRLDTLLHMDLPPDASGGVAQEGSWELAVPDGAYQVTVTVGDAQKGSAPEDHVINAEGVALVEGFGNSPAANGSPDRHTTEAATVEVLDGRLTIDQDGGTNTKINYVEVTPVDGAGEPQTVAQVNFQTAATPTPSGWVADTGQLFTEDRGYGWVRTEGGATKAADTRLRTSESDPLTASLVIVDDSTVAGVVDGEWEYAVADGEYTVEVSVGDPDYADSVHSVDVEGTPVVQGFDPGAAGDYQTGEATVHVDDGALTLASTGTNTKLQWVRITSTSDTDVVPPRVAVALEGDGEDGEYSGPVTVTVTATDQTLEFVDYSVDGGPVQNYTAPFQVTGTGDHTVEVTATDGAGNVTERSVTFSIVQLGNGDLTLTNPEAAPFHDRLVMSRIQSTASNPSNADTAVVRLGNNGSAPLQVLGLQVADPDDFELVNPPQLPATVAVGSQLTLTVRFTGVGSGQNTAFESELRIRHNGSDGPSAVVELGAIWQSQSEGGNEPDVAEIVEAFGVGTTIVGSGQQVNNSGRLEKIGDEVHSRTWRRLNTSQPVTVRQLAAYHTCCNNTAAFGWHPVGNKGSFNRVLTHNGAWAQTLRPRIQGSGTNPALASFTPGPATWSWRIDPESSDWTLNDTSPDSCGSGNAGCQLGHHIRIWPVEDREGQAVPGQYFVTMDYSGINYDYNDNVYLVTNVAPADAQ
ncbi:OmpL47-type beta-barrel domain-containing protein [Desertihabitans brevis]|nr:Ig-like domain-containing protein [Desertihabitans brevis]